MQSDGRKMTDLRPENPKLSDLADQPAGRFAYPGGSRPLDGYTIKRGVGHGGFGEVYYAVSDAGKEVGLKLIRRNLDIEIRGIKQCLNLKHPNLLALYDIRQSTRGDNWVVMEFVGGRSLEDVVATHAQGMPVEEALNWFYGISTGVAYLHDHGIVHRDLKPGNIFSDEGLVKIGDYGLSKFIACSRRSGQTESVGTVHYMAPEVANGRYGKEIDIYALGIILYEMLTGRVPFEGESVGEVLMKHLTAEPDVSMLPQPYRGVVARALQKDPAKRFSSVGEMLDELPQPSGSQVQGVPWASVAGSGIADTLPGGGESPAASAIDEEPIWHATRQLFRKMSNTWNESNFNTPTKVALVVVAAFAFLATAEALVPLAMILLIAYGVYRLVRAVVHTGESPHTRSMSPSPAASSPSSPPPQPQAAAMPERPAGGHHQRSSLPRWYDKRERAAEALLLKPPRVRAAELVGSLLAGAMVAITMCLVMVILNSFRGEIPQAEQCAWLALVSIAGTWAVLVPSKFWEGARGEPMLRRFILMVIGLGLGAVAFGVATGLMVELPHQFPPSHDYQLPASFFDGHGHPLLMAHLACFGSLLLLIRWWRQANPLRSTRLSLLSTMICVVVAALVASAWHFPQPWLPMVAGAMSVSVQLSSPWIHPRKRVPRNNI